MAQNTVSVIVKGIDRVSHILDDVRDQLRSLRDFPVELDVFADTSRAERAIGDLANRDIHLDVNVDTAMARAELSTLYLNPDIHIDVETNTARARAELESLRFVKDIHIPVEVETAKARAEMEALRLVKDIHIPVELDTAKAWGEINALHAVRDIDMDVDLHIKEALAKIEALKKALPDKHFLEVFLKANQANMRRNMEQIKRALPNEHFLNVRIHENQGKAEADLKKFLASLPDEHEIKVVVDKAKEVAFDLNDLFEDEKELNINTDNAEKSLSRLEKYRLDPIAGKIKYMQSLFETVTDTMDLSKLQEMVEFQEAFNDGSFDTKRIISEIEKRMESVKKHIQEAGDSGLSESMAQAVGQVQILERDFEKFKKNLQVISTQRITPEMNLDTSGMSAQAQRAAQVARDMADNHLRQNAPFLRLNLQHFAQQTQQATQQASTTAQTISSSFSSIGTAITNLPSISGKLLILPAVIPAIAAVTAAIGGLTASLVAAGAQVTLVTGGLVAGFAAAGIGVAGFAAVAIPQISNIFSKASELAALEEQLKNAKDWEEKCRIMEEMAALQAGINEKQMEGINALKEYQAWWAEFSKPFEMHSINIFVASLKLLQETLTVFQPAFMAAAHAIEGLMADLEVAMQTPEFKAFTAFINETAGPAVTLFGQAFGFAIQGIMNLITAFGPYAMQMMEGFRGMMESFANWSAKLSESKGFQDFVAFAQNEGVTALGQLGEVFSNVFTGISGIVSAFMPHAETLMQVFVDLSARFAEWGQTLANNPQFQEFIQMGIDNIPVVVGILTDLGTTIFNLMMAFAPLGEVLLGIIATVADWIAGLTEANPAVNEVIATVGWLVAALIPVVGGVMKVVDVFKTFGGAIKTAWSVISPIITKLGPLFSSVFGVITTIVRTAVGLLFTPQGLIIAAIVILVALIIKYWDEIVAFLKKVWDGIVNIAKNVWDGLMLYFKTVLAVYQKVFETIWNAISKFLEILWKAIQKVAETIFDAVSKYFETVLNFYRNLFETIWNGISNFLSNIWDGIQRVAETVWNAVTKFFSTLLEGWRVLFDRIWNGISNFLSNLWSGIERTASTIWNGIMKVITSPIETARTVIERTMNLLRGALDGIWAGIQSAASTAWNSIGGVIKGAINGVIKGINGFLGAIGRIKINIPKVSIPGTDISVGGGSIGMPNIPKIPLLAKGGLVSQATMAVIGEGRHEEAVLPLNRQVYQKLADGISGQGGSGGITINQEFHTNVSEATIQHATERAIRKQSRNWGIN